LLLNKYYYNNFENKYNKRSLFKTAHDTLYLEVYKYNMNYDVDFKINILKIKYIFLKNNFIIL
jgi:hypothetical protein